jgi:hypothetical protein
MKLVANRTIGRGFRWARGPLAGVLLAFAVASDATGQTPGGIRDWDDGIKYARGQNVVPVYEGWVENPDGTFSLVFGFWNRNWEETVFIPVGPDNKIEPGGIDQGQPTVFTARRGKNMFEIVVPKDFGKKEVIWTITSRGKTERAFGALIPQEVLTRRMVLAGGALSANADAGNDDTGDEKSGNEPPTVTIDPVQAVTLPGRATLTASITDDGFGGDRPGRGGRPRRVRVEWITYRGPAVVTFGAAMTELESPKGGKATTSATFTAPGTYVLRATATDAGGYAVNKDVTITVK